MYVYALVCDDVDFSRLGRFLTTLCRDAFGMHCIFCMRSLDARACQLVYVCV
jgi:hypothetical protein